MENNKNVMPFVKWVGGKRQLISEIEKLLPNSDFKYCEPFVGGGALFFHLRPKVAIINDLNEELINAYKIIKDNPNDLIESLARHKNTEEYFYEIRKLDRDDDVFSSLNLVERASRFIYLNKTCYNGLYRVNSAGEFNTPYGKYKNPNIVNKDVISSVHGYLKNNNITILNGEYMKLLPLIDSTYFVYLDPPYDPVSDTANFTSYNSKGFGKEDQRDLKKFCDALDKKGAKFMLSNSNTPFIRELYSGYNISVVGAARSINSNAMKRGKVEEVLVTNYDK